LVTIGELEIVYGIKSNNPVITYEQLYVTIKECHERVGHHGRNKTWNEVVSTDNIYIYCLCTTKCIISSKYHTIDLLDLAKYDFPELRGIDPQILPTKTFIQACKDYANVGSISVVEACSCNGGCTTQKCPYKVACGTKCYPAKKKSCSNI
ncbi:unnamed protein product, partial [Rotaria sp. Silwood2]